MTTRITLRSRGPLVVEGDDVEIVDADGNALEPPSKKSIRLCRCGASKNKPFCDGSHLGIGFDDS